MTKMQGNGVVKVLLGLLLLSTLWLFDVPLDSWWMVVVGFSMGFGIAEILIGRYIP